MTSRDAAFVDREEELGILRRVWGREGFALLILYGRRRVGKTRLLREFCSSAGVECAFYVAVPQPEAVARDELIEVIRRSLGVRVTGRDAVEVIEGLSRELKVWGKRAVLVLDEFQYLAESSPGLIGRLQRAIDEALRQDSSLMLVICGSAVSFTERELLGYRSPLYGRRTASMKLRPLSPVKVAGFYPGWGLAEVLEAYGVLGGTPAYHELFDPRQGLWDNVLHNILRQGSYLLDEAMNLLRQEVREPRTYFSMLSAIAAGVTSPAKLAQAAGIDPRTVGKYISLLENLDIVRRISPVGRRRPVQVRFADNYFRFWFTFIKPHQGLIEAGLGEEVLKTIKQGWATYMGQILEDAVTEMLPDLIRAGLVKAVPSEYGRWWHKGEEIDLVIVGPDTTQFIEVKWRTMTAREVRHALDRLREKAGKTGVSRRRAHYTLITKEMRGHPTLEKDESAYDLSDLGELLRIPGNCLRPPSP